MKPNRSIESDNLNGSRDDRIGSKSTRSHVIGVIGGAGSGKTYIGKMITAMLKADFIEADKVGHTVIAKEDIVSQIVSVFGSDVLSRDNESNKSADDSPVMGLEDAGRASINRKVLGGIVFNSVEKRQVLNRIMHGAMYEEISRMIEDTSAEFVVMEAAVMIEAGFDRLVDTMILITADEAIRYQRLTGDRGIDSDKARSLVGLVRNDLKDYADYTFDTTYGSEPIAEDISDVCTQLINNRMKMRSTTD